ncbi:hypothetical protein SDC9_37567 [bioreactor metagenome]|jgi:hypothetical protein|uniref:Thioredoxin-like fold domain-containing protein n=1 Tax=bioreactor metagenome TaxID=1076179 RepID=A0A644VJK2_9ZZZZ|nr:hypothetical protein [Bacteroidales bacterium]
MKNVYNMNKSRLFSIIGISLFLFNSCQICIETPRTIRKSASYQNNIPLTAKELKSILTEDTTHYKFVVIYSPCCGPCYQHFRLTYPKVMSQYDTSQVVWYFILDDTGGIKYNEKFLKNLNIRTKMYYFREETPEFSNKNENKWNNLANYLFPDSINKIDDIYGIPFNFIVNKEGKVKKVVFNYSNGIKRISTLSLYYIMNKSVMDIDFYNITDTIDVDYNPYVCSGDNCKVK